MRDVSSLFSVGEAVDEILREGPLDEDELLDALEQRGLRLGDDPVSLVFDSLSADIDQVGGVFVNLYWMVESLRLAVDVPADAGDRLTCEDALELLTITGWEGFELDDGTGHGWVDVEEADTMSERDVMVGPPGWLAAVAGRRAVVTVDGDSLSLALDERTTANDEQVSAAFRDAYEATLRDPRPMLEVGELDPEVAVGSMTVLIRMAVDAHGLLGRRVVPPLETLAADAGLEVRGHQIAPAGTDWELVAMRQRHRRFMTMHRLDPLAAERLNLLLGAAGQCVADGVLAPDPADRAGAAAFLASSLMDSGMCDAFLAEWSSFGYGTDELVAFGSAILDDLGDHDPSGVVCLLAISFDDVGLVSEAIAMLDRVVDHSEHSDLLVLRACFAADQGDAQYAARLLRRAGTSPADPDDDDGDGVGDLGVGESGDRSRAESLWDEIGPFLGRAPAAAKRNDPCPCGSGKKYKACHQGGEQHPLERRAGWLFHKALRYLEGHAMGEHQDHVVAATKASTRGYQMMKALIGGELIGDVTLHEGGVWDDFMADRGRLLPDDEQLLASQWALIDRSVFEIESTRPDGMRLRDLRTGDRVTVEHVTTDGLRPGMLLVGRLLPVGDSRRAFAGLLPIGDALRDRAMEVMDEADAEEVAALLGTALQPPQMRNTDGESLRFHTTTWLVDETTDAAAVLQQAGWKVQDTQVSFVRDSSSQRDTVIAAGTIEGRRLTLEVNSDERAEEMFRLLRSLLPGSLVLEMDVRELHEVMAVGSSGIGGAAPLTSDGRSLSAEQEREVMTQYMAMAEQRWLDEQVPALRGMTPREAAADPIGRIELQRLLASFPDTDDPTQMSARRLSDLLGL
jgi:hypothetical protein